MGLKVAEKGKTIVLYTGYDMQNSTDLEVYLYSPSSVSATIANARLSVVNSTYTDPALGSLAPNTYAQFDTLATDLTEAGTWSIYLRYTDTNKILYSDTGSLAVESVGF